jgi:hypothetical protein
MNILPAEVFRRRKAAISPAFIPVDKVYLI